MQFKYPEGATPLGLDEASGLMPRHITNHGQLNEWEFANVVQGERWAFGDMVGARRRKFATLNDLLTPAFIRRLHKRMFGDTWRWAGLFRATEKNIGLDPAQISVALQNLCEDVKVQLQSNSDDKDELAARLSHRLVTIHPFANGNGRLSRTYADLILIECGLPRFTWGATTFAIANQTRVAYIAALRSADARDYKPLLDFVRS